MSDLEVSIWAAKIKANGTPAVVSTLLALIVLAALVLFCGIGGLLVGAPGTATNAVPQAQTLPTNAGPSS